MDLPAPVERWSLLATALVLVALTLFHLLLSTHRLLEALFADGLALLLLLAVVHVGYRLAVEESPDFTAVTTAWTLTGVAGMGMLVLWLLTFDRLAGVVATSPVSTAIVFLAVGALFGLSLGLNDARRRQHSSELSVERERVEFLNELLRHNVLNALQVILGSAERIQNRADAAAPSRAGTDGGAVSEAAEPASREAFAGEVADDAATVSQWASDAARQVRKMHLLTGGDGEALGPVRLDTTLREQTDKVAGTTEASITLDAPQRVWVRADEALAALFESLLLNAVDHGAVDGEPAPGESASGERRSATDPPSGPVRIRVAVAACDDAVTVRVVDDGPGFPPAIRRAIDRNRPEPDVFGFGLYLVSTLVSRYGGDLDAGDSARGDVDLDGAAIAVTLPRADPSATA